MMARPEADAAAAGGGSAATPLAHDAAGSKVLFSVMQVFPPVSIRPESRKRGSGDAKRGSRCDAPDAGATSDDGSGGDAGKPKRSRTARGAKPRKPSHVMIREEKETLRKELALLETRAALLRRRAGLPDVKELAATRETAMENARLADALRSQEQLVAGAHAALSEFVHRRAANPLEGFVRLSKGLEERSAEVAALKSAMLEKADRFLTERARLADPATTGLIREESGVVTPEGDYVLTKLDTTCFRDVGSVRHVFEAMKFYFLNLEIANSELSGDISIREDSGLDSVDTSDSNGAVLAHRMVTLLPSGVLLEKNALKVMQLYDGGQPDEAFAVLAAVPIDEDDLYPYASSERLRMDMAVSMKLSAYYEHATVDAGAAGQLVVEFTRWFRVRLHHNEAVRVPDFVLQSVRRSLSEPLDNIVKSMEQTLYGVPAV